MTEKKLQIPVSTLNLNGTLYSADTTKIIQWYFENFLGIKVADIKIKEGYITYSGIINTPSVEKTVKVNQSIKQTETLLIDI